MAISHAGHDHPATPAGRAACRKVARCTCGGNPDTDGRILIHSHTCPMKGAGNPPQAAAAGPARPARPTTTATAAKPPTTRTRGLSGDAAVNFARTHGECPNDFIIALSACIRFGYVVDLPSTDDMKIQVSSGEGTVTFTWSDDPDYRAIAWRRTGHSVTRRIAHAYAGMDYLAGK